MTSAADKDTVVAGPDDLWLRIFLINDVYELDNFPSLQTLIQLNSRTKDRSPDRVLTILAGDFLGPSLLSSLDNGSSMVDCLNALKVHAVCIGNHETDVSSMSELLARIQQSNFVWINSNMQDLNEKVPGCDTPEYDIVVLQNEKKTIEQKIAFLGLLTDDSTLYRPGSFGDAKIEPVISTAERLREKLLATENVDLVIPLTHQLIAEDRTFCTHFGSDFPIVLGGHDHEPFDETHNSSRVVKTGMDADRTAVIDIVWTANNSPPIIRVEMLHTTSFLPDSDMLRRVQCHQTVLRELKDACIFTVKDWCTQTPVFSTRNNRLEPSSGSTAFCSMIRMGMHAECAIMNAGSIRAGKDYDNDHHFSWGDLKAEFPFATMLTACCLPGQVLEDCIRHSRADSKLNPPVARGGYLQICDHIEYDNDQEKIISLAGQPFDPNQSYCVALPVQFFQGIDNHAPLLEWAESTKFSMQEDSGRPSKNVIVSTFSSLLWLQLGSFRELDVDKNGVITKEEVYNKLQQIYGKDVSHLVVDHIFNVADLSGKGVITPLDMTIVQYSAKDMIRKGRRVARRETLVMKSIAAQVLAVDPNHEDVIAVVNEIRNSMDKNHDGNLERDEILQAMQSEESRTQSESYDVLEGN